MQKIYSPENELDLAFIKSLLESENIQFFVHNDHFGSLKIGPKINLLNAKTIFVSEKDTDKAKEIIECYIEEQNREEVEPKRKTVYSWKTKLRIIMESILFFWFVPQGRRWKKNK